MFSEIVTSVSAAISLYEKRHSIDRTLKRFRRAIQTGTWRVPIFGAGGTGKTLLGKFLAGEIDTEVIIPRYRESIESMEYSFAGSAPALFFVPPGQELRRPETWPDLYRMFAVGKARGVINVVSWGYHSSGAEYARHKAYDSGLTAAANLSVILDYNRKAEICALRNIIPHLQVARRKIWMITLVTKQDLWWEARHDVERHYKEGEYQALLDEILQEKGPDGFRHTYFSVSLVPQNLISTDGMTLAITTGGYDQLIRIQNLSDFLAGLSELLQRKRTS